MNESTATINQLLAGSVKRGLEIRAQQLGLGFGCRNNCDFHAIARLTTN